MGILTVATWSVKVKMIVTCVALFLVIVILSWITLSIKSCISAHRAKVTQEQVDKINQANAAARKAELEKVITDNAETVKTVDGRTAITNLTTEERSAEVAKKVADADAKVAQAKAGGHNVTPEELIALIEGN